MAGEVQAKGDGQQYHGSVLEILTIVLACVSVLVVTVRGVARHRISRIVESTDILLPVALVSDTRLPRRCIDNWALITKLYSGVCTGTDRVCTLGDLEWPRPTRRHVGCRSDINIRKGMLR